MSNQYADAFDAAANAQMPVFHGTFYGKAEIVANFVILEKGVGQVPFDPNVHAEKDKRTSIKLAVFLLPEMAVRFDLERSMLAESKAWIEITWASLKALGLTNPRDVYNRYVEVTLAPTGRKWTDAWGEHEETVLKFTALYPNEDECLKAFLASKNGGTPAASSNGSQAATQTVATPPTDERAVALQFANTLVINAVKGKTDINEITKAVQAALAANPVVSKYFTVNSPEIMQMIVEAMKK